MLKKRLIGVITVKDGKAVQSIGYDRYLPLGRAECLAENLDRWGVDEILVLSIDRTRRGLGPDLELLRRVSALGLSTPLTYGGGIRTAQQAAQVIQSGADRLCIDAILHDERPEEIRNIAQLVGAQALVASLPVAIREGSIEWLDYRSRRSRSLSESLRRCIEQGLISEALLIDWQHEGVANGFDARLVQLFPIAEIPIIVFGGISAAHQLSALLAVPQIAAVAVGNFLNYTEHAVQNLKNQIPASPLRPGVFFAGNGL